MPKIKMPDGVVVRFPDDMPPDEIKALILKKFPELGAGSPAAAAAAPADQQPATGGEPAADQPPAEEQPPSFLENVVGNTASALNTLGDVASFGIAPAIQRTVMNAFNPGSGDELQRTIDQTNAANPAGQVAGFAAAIPVGMALTGGLGEAIAAPLQATRAAPIANAFLTAGGKTGQLGRMAVTGGTGGAVEAAAHGGGADEILTGAGLGAVLGPAAGVAAPAVVGTVKRIVQGPGAKAWRYLADKIGASPAEVQAAVDAYVQRTGRQPSVQQIMTDHDAGVLAQFGSQQPHAGAVLREGADATTTVPTGSGAASLPGAPTLLANVAPGDASVTVLLDARDRATDTAVDAIRTNPVSLPDWLVDDIIGSPALNSRKWQGVRDRISTDTATIDDIDKVRKRLQKINANEYSTDIDDLIDDLRQHTPAEYTQIMDDYAAASRYIDAFDMGTSGTNTTRVTNAGQRNTLNSAEGRAALDVGTTMREGAQRARSSAPSTLRPQTAQSAASNAGTAIADVAIGAPISGARQAIMAITKVAQGLNLPPRLQREIAEGLTSTDPAVRNATIERLRRASISNENIRRLRVAASGSTGAVVGESVPTDRGKEPFETAVGVQ